VANIKSQKKRNRQNEARRVRNKGVRSELKTRVKRVHDGVAAGEDDVDERLRLAQKRLAKAGEKGVIHRNQASRRISRLMKRAARDAQAS
jgi:small subunit ribosomal protein S20